MEQSPHMQKVQEIHSAVTARRNKFLTEYQNPRQGKRALTYEPALDREVYKVLKRYEHDPEKNAYVHVQNELNAYTEFQVETFIGERLNVGLSSFRYDLRDGEMYGQGMNESLLDMISRGRAYREQRVKDVDIPRQEAEIVQFTKIQDVMTSPQAELGTTIVSISPPGGEGSVYAHNFYDVFVLSEDSEKNRYVAARRYASGLSLDEYKQLASHLSAGYMNDYRGESLDSYFLSKPLVLAQSSLLSGDPEAIHKFLHKGHEFLSSEDFNYVKRAIAGLITSYVNTLVENPSDELLLNSTLNVIMNEADTVADNLKYPSRRIIEIHDRSVRGSLTREDILSEGKKKVRSVATGCGESTGFEVGGENRLGSNMSSFNSMYDFGTDTLGSRTFHCPDCGEMNLRPLDETLKECQNCHSPKVAC